jgi:hypothetical protein
VPYRYFPANPAVLPHFLLVGSMNPALDFVRTLAEQGYHPSTVVIETTGNRWQVRVTLDDWLPPGELPGRRVGANNHDRTQRVSVAGRDRFDDQVVALRHCSEGLAERWIQQIAETGKARDYARIGDRRWITKPIEWLREPLRSALSQVRGS